MVDLHLAATLHCRMQQQQQQKQQHVQQHVQIKELHSLLRTSAAVLLDHGPDPHTLQWSGGREAGGGRGGAPNEKRHIVLCTCKALLESFRGLQKWQLLSMYLSMRTADMVELKTHQNRPEPRGMLLRVNLLNLDAETELPDAVSKAMRFWDRLTGSTADQ